MTAEMQAIDPASRLGRLIVRQAQKRHLAALWAELAGMAPGMTVLDIGAGSGALAFEYADLLGAGGLVMVLDPDADCLAYVAAEAARRRLPLRTLQGTAEALPPLPALPDRIMLTDALHHMADPLAALHQLHTVLPAHGVLFIAEYDPAGPGLMGAKLSRRTDPGALAGMLMTAGFTITLAAPAPDEHYTIIARR